MTKGASPLRILSRASHRAPTSSLTALSGFVIRHSSFAIGRLWPAILVAIFVPAFCSGQATPTSAPAAASLISAEKAAKDGSVWGALVFASNGKEARPAASADAAKALQDFPDLPKRLGKVFPYTNFEVLGQHT